MTIQKINETIKKVITMQHGPEVGDTLTADYDTLKLSKPIFTKLEQKIKEVWEDDDLSPQGKANKERELKKEAAKELAEFVQKYKEIQQKELEEAEKMAKKIISEPDAKPDQFILNEWKRKYDELKTDLTVFGTQSSAHALMDFVQKTQDPYFANMIVDDFADIHAKASPFLQRTALATVYTNVKKAAAGDVKTQAREKLEQIKRLKERSPVNSMITMSIDRSLGEEYRHVLTNPQNYL